MPLPATVIKMLYFKLNIQWSASSREMTSTCSVKILVVVFANLPEDLYLGFGFTILYNLDKFPSQETNAIRILYELIFFF